MFHSEHAAQHRPLGRPTGHLGQRYGRHPPVGLGDRQSGGLPAALTRTGEGGRQTTEPTVESTMVTNGSTHLPPNSTLCKPYPQIAASAHMC